MKETPSLAEALSFAGDVVGGKLTSAKKVRDPAVRRRRLMTCSALDVVASECSVSKTNQGNECMKERRSSHEKGVKLTLLQDNLFLL